MQDSFDPYQQWLNIPPAEQPPDYYRLLGLKRGERDPAIINFAAAARTAQLRELLPGQRRALAERLLEEIRLAQETLRDPERSKLYLDQLKTSPKAPRDTQAALPVAERAPSAAKVSGDTALPEIVTDSARAAGTAGRTEKTAEADLQPSGSGLPEIAIDTAPRSRTAGRTAKAKKATAQAPKAALPEIAIDTVTASGAAGRTGKTEKAAPQASSSGLPEIATDSVPSAATGGRTGKTKKAAAPAPNADLPEIAIDTVAASGAAARPSTGATSNSSPGTSAGCSPKKSGSQRSQLELVAWCLGGGAALILAVALLLVVTSGGQPDGPQRRSSARRSTSRSPAHRPSSMRMRPSAAQRPRGPANMGDLMARAQAELEDAKKKPRPAGTNQENASSPATPAKPMRPSPHQQPLGPQTMADLMTQAKEQSPETASKGGGLSMPAADSPAALLSDVTAPPAQPQAPVPEADLLARAIDQVRNSLQDKFLKADSAEARSNLAAELLKLGEDATDDPLRRYACFELAREQAERVGAPELIDQVVRRLNQHYEVDALYLRAETMAAAWRSDYAIPHRPALFAHSQQMLAVAVRQKDSDVARQAIRVVMAGARSARNHRLIRELEELQREMRTSWDAKEP